MGHAVRCMVRQTIHRRVRPAQRQLRQPAGHMQAGQHVTGVPRRWRQVLQQPLGLPVQQHRLGQHGVKLVVPHAQRQSLAQFVLRAAAIALVHEDARTQQQHVGVERVLVERDAGGHQRAVEVTVAVEALCALQRRGAGGAAGERGDGGEGEQGPPQRAHAGPPAQRPADHGLRADGHAGRVRA